MTTYTSTGATKHVTAGLAAGTPDTVTLDRPYPLLEVMNDDLTNGFYVWIARGDVDSIPGTLTAGMDGSWWIPPGGTRVLVDDAPALNLPSKLALFATATVTGYHVHGLGR